MNSKEKLAQALETEFKNPETQRKLNLKGKADLHRMIENAKDGYYSDYDSPLAIPWIQLVKDLWALGLEELKVRAMNGEFDATKEESAAWYEREGRQMIEKSGLPKELFGGTEEEKEAKEGIKGWDY